MTGRGKLSVLKVRIRDKGGGRRERWNYHIIFFEFRNRLKFDCLPKTEGGTRDRPIRIKNRRGKKKKKKKID